MANARLKLSYTIIHWPRWILRPGGQLLPGPPPTGRTRLRTSPEITVGMNINRHPNSTRSFFVIRFTKYPHEFLEVTGIIKQLVMVTVSEILKKLPLPEQRKKAITDFLRILPVAFQLPTEHLLIPPDPCHKKNGQGKTRKNTKE